MDPSFVKFYFAIPYPSTIKMNEVYKVSRANKIINYLQDITEQNCTYWIIICDAQVLQHGDSHILTPCCRIARPTQENLIFWYAL